MTTTAPETLAPAAPAAVTAAPPERRWRSVLGWLAILALLVIAALFASTFAAQMPEGGRGTLDPESTRDRGARAIAELLRDEGVEITIARTRAEALAAIDDDTTLVMTDPYPLTDDGVHALIEPANHVVLLSTSARTLDLLGIGAYAGGWPDAALEPGCDAPELAGISRVEPDRLFTPADGATGCFADGDGDGVLIDDRGGVRRIVVEGVDLFSNAHLADDHNAALGLALMGQSGSIVWYVPSFADSDYEATGPDTLGTLTPPWVTPAILLLIAAGIVVAVARGRRFGPLVAENLPVTVRASETMHGRARLTARAADAPHAAEALRDGARRRLAARLGLSARASAAEVADAASDRLRIARGSLHDLLDGPLPTSDADLIDHARRLAELEAAIDSVLHGERKKP